MVFGVCQIDVGDDPRLNIDGCNIIRHEGDGGAAGEQGDAHTLANQVQHIGCPAGGENHIGGEASLFTGLNAEGIHEGILTQKHQRLIAKLLDADEGLPGKGVAFGDEGCQLIGVVVDDVKFPGVLLALPQKGQVALAGAEQTNELCGIPLHHI